MSWKTAVLDEIQLQLDEGAAREAEAQALRKEAHGSQIAEIDRDIHDLRRQLDEVREFQEALGGIGDEELELLLDARLDLARLLVGRARGMRATDIHLDPGEDEWNLRQRIDGSIVPEGALSRDLGALIVRHFQLRAKLHITKPFDAEEGHVHFATKIPDLDARVTLIPCRHAHALHVRLLDARRITDDLVELGMSPEQRDRVRDVLHGPPGLILCCGPTGGGKSTTLYSTISTFELDRVVAISIEEPIEFHLEQIRQVQADPKHGLTLEAGLSVLLRMDPDVLLIGEIRGKSTADIAVRAATSGHFCFSTLHARDAAGALSTLRSVPMTDHEITSAVRGLISQRLLRRVCSGCATEVPADDRAARLFAAHGQSAPDRVTHGTGCDACRGTGYHGRVGVFEIATIDEDTSERILQGLSEHGLRKLLRERGVSSVVQDALEKVRQGVTTIAEVEQIYWPARGVTEPEADRPQ